MKNIVFAIFTAFIVAQAGSAAALSFVVDFPVLTYPPQPDTSTTKGCVNLATVNGEACTVTPR